MDLPPSQVAGTSQVQYISHVPRTLPVVSKGGVLSLTSPLTSKADFFKILTYLRFLRLNFPELENGSRGTWGRQIMLFPKESFLKQKVFMTENVQLLTHAHRVPHTYPVGRKEKCTLLTTSSHNPDHLVPHYP